MWNIYRYLTTVTCPILSVIVNRHNVCFSNITDPMYGKQYWKMIGGKEVACSIEKLFILNQLSPASPFMRLFLATSEKLSF